MKNWNLENKKALVTGGSKGIGRAVVNELAALGAEVLLTGKDQSDLQPPYEAFSKQKTFIHFLSGDVRVIKNP